jgi:hypothetical protein
MVDLPAAGWWPGPTTHRRRSRATRLVSQALDRSLACNSVAEHTIEGPASCWPHSTASGGGHPPDAGRPGAPPAGASSCGPPASTADNTRSAWSTRGRRRRQSRPVASAWFSASTAATSSWSRPWTWTDRSRLPSSGARSTSRSHRRMRSTRAARIGGQERARCPASSAVRTDGSWGGGGSAGVLLQRSGLGVPGRPPARSPDQPADEQPDNQRDQQRPAEGSQPLGLGRGRRASSRRRGGRRRRQRRSRRRRCGRRRGRRRNRRRGPSRRRRRRAGPGRRRRNRGRGSSRRWRRSGGPGRSRRCRDRLAGRLGHTRGGTGAGSFRRGTGRRFAPAAGAATAEPKDQAQHEARQQPRPGCPTPKDQGSHPPVPARRRDPPRHPGRPHQRPPPDQPGQAGGARPACDAGHSSAGGPPAASPEAGENTVPHGTRLHLRGPGGTDGTER